MASSQCGLAHAQQGFLIEQMPWGRTGIEMVYHQCGVAHAQYDSRIEQTSWGSTGTEMASRRCEFACEPEIN